MTVLLPWFALVVTILAGWAIIKRLSTSMVLLFADQLCRDLRCSRLPAERR